MSDILERIVVHKREEIAAMKKRGLPEPEIEISPLRGFRKVFAEGNSLAIIAEVKKASPSKGLICHDFEPISIARDYEAGGAGAVSVLTDEFFFQGDIEFLPLIRQNVSLPLLRKDFILDHIQVDEARLWGADAILLIAACLDMVELQELYAHAREAGLDCLVEVHDMREFEQVMNVGVDLVGVNNRNLKDFSVSLDTTFRIVESADGTVPIISESGISCRKDIERLEESGVSGALIGEALVRAEDRVAMLKELLGVN
jgi:indole-3-glycerol phosphate synthase